MKNVRQLVELNHIKETKIRELFEREYIDCTSSSDNYFRYYPSSDSYDKSKDATLKLNKWLVKEGYELKLEDEYFHLLIRWDW